MSQAFGSAILRAKSNGTIVITPPDSPYFWPKRVRMAAINPKEPFYPCDFKVNSITIGGSPQLAISCLDPTESSKGLHPEDFDLVNWSVFSTIGLARELILTAFNPCKHDIIIFVCIEGENIDHLDETLHSNKPYRTVGGIREEAKPIKEDIDCLWTEIASKEWQLKSFDQKIIPIEPDMTPYFEPHRIQFHGHRISDNCKTPYAIINAYCGSRLLLGSNLIDLINRHIEPPLVNIPDSLQALENISKSHRTTKWLYSLLCWFLNRYQLVPNTQPVPPLTDAKGVLTSLLTDPITGWGAIRWPVLSVNSLGRELGVIAHNPWPFEIRISVSMRGNPASSLSLDHKPDSDEETLPEESSTESK